MDPEREQLDPREMEALQRDMDALENIDQPPELATVPEPPAAAEQPAAPVAQPMPDPTREIQAPDISAPVIDEVLEPMLAEVPDFDISSTPKRRKLSALQKRRGQVEPPPEPLLPDPDPAADQPRQQPPEPVAPDFGEFVKEAVRLGGVAANELVKLVDWDDQVDPNGAPEVGKAADAGEAAKEKDAALLAFMTQSVANDREFAAQLRQMALELKRIRLGAERSRM